MKTYAICPISERLMDERIARLNASITVLVLITAGWLQLVWLLIILSGDFLLRGTDWSGYSPITAISRKLLRFFKVNKITINAGPKMFAARIGFVFTLSMIVLSLFYQYTPAYMIGFVLGMFCFLEAAFGICVACKIYPFIYRILYKF